MDCNNNTVALLLVTICNFQYKNYTHCILCPHQTHSFPSLLILTVYLFYWFNICLITRLRTSCVLYTNIQNIHLKPTPQTKSNSPMHAQIPVTSKCIKSHCRKQVQVHVHTQNQKWVSPRPTRRTKTLFRRKRVFNLSPKWSTICLFPIMVLPGRMKH